MRRTFSGGTVDTLVVGTGIGGLTAGLSLARRGRRVLLLEAGKQFGGMLNPFARRRFHFDVGVHYVGEAGERQAMRRMLDGLGLESIRFREIDPDCIDRYVFDGYEGRLVKGIDRWREVLVADFPHQRRQIDGFLDLMRACRSVQGATMGHLTLSRLIGVARQGRALLRLFRQPFSEVLAEHFDDPMLRNVLAGPGGDIGLPPSRASALASIMVLNHFLRGGYYPVGGSGAMRDAYVAELDRHGAELLRNRRVERIEARPGGGFAVHAHTGERFEARSVISNADVAHTVEMIEGVRPGFWVRRKARTMRPSLGAFCLFLGTDLDPTRSGLSDSNIWHYGCSDIEAGYASAYRGELPDKPFFFLTVPTLKDPDTPRAPEGYHTVELITFVPAGPFKPWFDRPAMRRGPAYEAVKAEMTERLLEGAEGYLPGLRDHIAVQESATPATVWHFVRGRGGGIYGPEHTADQMFHRRLAPPTGVPGLFLAGASVFGAGILTCMLSGLAAGQLCHWHLRARRLRSSLALPRLRSESRRALP